MWVNFGHKRGHLLTTFNMWAKIAHVGNIHPRPYRYYGMQNLPTLEGTLNLSNNRHVHIAVFMLITKVIF